MTGYFLPLHTLLSPHSLLKVASSKWSATMATPAQTFWLPAHSLTFWQKVHSYQYDSLDRAPLLVCMPLMEAELVSSTCTLLGREPFNLILLGHLLPPGLLQLCSHDFPTSGHHYLIAVHQTERDCHGCTLNAITTLLLCPVATHAPQIHGCIMGIQDVAPESALLAPSWRQEDLHWHHLPNAWPAQFSLEQSCSDVRPGDGHRCTSVNNHKVCLAPIHPLAFRLLSFLSADMLNAPPLTCFLSPSQSSLRQFFLAQSYHQSIPR
jgi:hypothetical protein